MIGDEMTNREKEILSILSKNPMISQIELSEILGITRSSVAVHIGNLIKKGHILGKGYILNNDDYITVIGGANIDIAGFPKNKLILNDSNPGHVKVSLGGVGRNIAENLSRIGVNVKLITAIGNDEYGKKILDESTSYKIDMNNSMIVNNKPTSVYLSILDNNRDMKLAISSMDIIDSIDTEYIQSRHNIINNSKVVIIDTNLKEETIKYLVENFDTNFIVDAVSTIKAEKIIDIIGKFNTVKLNKIEAEKVSGIKIKDKNDLKKCCDSFINKGVKQIFITLGEDGVYYQNEHKSNLIKSKARSFILMKLRR